jgi:hypothetical protein
MEPHTDQDGNFCRNCFLRRVSCQYFVMREIALSRTGYTQLKLRTLTLIALVATTPVMADEVWQSSQLGQITYLEDVGKVAILSTAGSHPGSTVQLYIEGLVGNFDSEGLFTGYWIENAQGECADERVGADGRASNNWGLLEIELDTRGVGRELVGRIGLCSGEFADEFVAEAVVPSSNAAAANSTLFIEGAIKHFECGDSCYLTLETSFGEETGLCASGLCEEWFYNGEMPLGEIGKRVGAQVEAAMQVNGEGDPMGLIISFEDTRYVE